MCRFLHLYTFFYKKIVFIFNMAENNLTKKDVQDIVKDEMSKFISSKLEEEISKLLKRGKPREEVVDLMKSALTSLYKYMWIRKDVWTNDIK